MRKISLLLLTVFATIQAFSQVGIGNVVPDSNAILDLRNTNNKAILLPDIPGIPPSSPNGLMYWDSSLEKVMYRESGGYNALSPWKFKFNGSTSDNLTFNVSGGNFGIGLDDPQRKFHLKENGESFVLEGTSSAYIGLYPNSFASGSKGRLGFTTTSTTLVIEQQTSGADVEVKVSNGGDFNVQGGRIQQNGNDLMPRGAIIMWSGTSIPNGWALCNGGNFTDEDGVSVTTPDLTGKFIVGYGTSDVDYNNPGNRSEAGSSNGNSGGEKTHTLTEAEMPAHTHTFSGTASNTSSDGNHTHKVATACGSCSGSSAHNTSKGVAIDGNNDSSPDFDARSSHIETNGSHSHSVTASGTNATTGSGSAHENRPPYYTLAFIMKK